MSYRPLARKKKREDQPPSATKDERAGHARRLYWSLPVRSHRRQRFAPQLLPDTCQNEAQHRRARMHGNGVGPAPRKTHTTKHDREATKKGETARTFTEGAAARFVVAQFAGRRAIINPDRQVVFSARHRSREGRIDATRRSDDAQLLPHGRRH